MQVAACGQTMFFASLESREIRSDSLPGREKRVAGVRPTCLKVQAISRTVYVFEGPHKQMMHGSHYLHLAEAFCGCRTSCIPQLSRDDRSFCSHHDLLVQSWQSLR